MSVFTKIKEWALRIKLDALAVYYAVKDSRTPHFLRFFAIVVVAYAISPIDLIPDFIPILGYLDDLLIVPIGLLFIIRMLPMEVLVDSRRKASARPVDSVRLKCAAIVVGTWLLCLASLSIWWYTR